MLTTVERISYLYETTINDMMHELQHSLQPGNHLDAQMVRHAVTIVRNGHVHSYRNKDNEIIVELADGSMETVRLLFERKEISCTCHKIGWCVHRLVVLFHLYSQFHSLTEWVHEWRQKETQQLTLSISERTPEAWVTALTHLTQPLRSIQDADSQGLFSHECHLIEQKVVPLIPFEWEWKPIFELYYRLHTLEASWRFLSAYLDRESTSFMYGKWYVKTWLYEQLDHLKSSVDTIGTKPKLFETDPFFNHLTTLVHSFCIEQDGLFDVRFQVYHLLWNKLFLKEEMRREELNRLRNSSSKDAFVFRAFFHLSAKEYDELTALLHSIPTVDVGRWLPLADFADQEEDITALQMIMEAIVPLLPEFIASHPSIHKRAELIRMMDGLLETAYFPEDIRENLFLQYGTAGVDAYADFLIERKRFSEWSALMHRFSISYERAEEGGLKVALSEAPEAVMPLLHHYAMGFIAEKNRHSYRRAVRLFRKMKNGAKKVGKIDFWNEYIETVQTKNRRLRALMEEIEKGNLLL